MPKRPNPFGDVVPVQLKTHVGWKEIAMGSRGEELMKEVYDRTQDKLFSAARRNNDINDNHMQPTAFPVPLQSACKFEPTQTLLDSTGHIITPLPFKDVGKGMGGDSMLHPETMACGDFDSWTVSSSSFTRQHTPVTSLPAKGGQLCLDSSGHLTAPQDSAMECDTEMETVGDHRSMCCEAVDKSVTVKPSPASGKGRGLHQFGFLSARQPSELVNKKQDKMLADMCQTCRHVPGKVRCHFCERAVCRSCIRQCDSCSDHFCQLCSTLNYDMAVERAFCLSCSE